MTKGIYALIIKNQKDQTLQIGKLGKFLFPKGLYVYIGSALGTSATSLEHRLPRHISRTKSIFWHIDFFLQAEFVEILTIFYAITSEKKECQLASTVSQIENAQIIIDRFGSSDCACKSHLPYFGVKADTLLEGIKISFIKIGLEPQIWQP
ncbi:MAG: GIY-YIG nuclease family protein [Candidatus Helarchaeota archaeon]|nr:GIY-YIG nuclease family protein [Candidatus Helarchaeota archaeon]